MININEEVKRYSTEGGLKVEPQGNEIKNKVENIALCEDFDISEIEAQLAQVDNVLEEKTKQVTQKAEQDFGESLNNYSVQAVEKTALVPVKEESKIIKNIKNIFAKIKSLFNSKKEEIVEEVVVDTDSQKESMKKIFSEGFKLSLKLVLDKLLGIGAIIDVFEFAETVKEEVSKMYANERPIVRNHNRQLAMEH